MNLPKELKTKLMKHQEECFEYSKHINKWILSDGLGLGKSLEIITIALSKMKEDNHCLIIVGVNGIKWNWKEEIKKHTSLDSTVLGERISRKGELEVKNNIDKLKSLDEPKTYFLITNIESLRDEKITAKLKSMCDSGKINMIAVDEVHTCKNSTSQQGKALLKLKADYMVAITGTPLLNTPIDLFVPLKWLGYEKYSLFIFRKRYCIMGGFGGHEILGYRNLDELQHRVNNIMLRRLKDDVLDLPPKVLITEYVEMGIKQKKIYNEIKLATILEADKIKASINPLSQLIRLRQATACTSIVSSTVDESVKFQRMEELVEEAVCNNDKVVIFSNWTEVTDRILIRLSKYNPVQITGRVGDAERQRAKNSFMTDNSCKVIVGTIGAMGTSYTLTSARTLIFVDLPYTYGLYEQCSDRIYRIGTTGSVNIISLVAKNTIDERILEIIGRKKKMSDAIVDQEYDLTKPEIVDYLLS